MADDAQRRLRLIRTHGRIVDAAPPFPELIRLIARSCRAVGLKTPRTGRVYDEKYNAASWFQNFIVAVDAHLLGSRQLISHDRNGKESRRSAKATYDLIAKALRAGGRKTGNPSK
jgi:hypothetical protein